MRLNSIKKLVHWLLGLDILLFIMTGLGITQFRVVDTITFGVLDRVTSAKIHNNPWFLITLAVLLIAHCSFPLWKRLFR